MQEDENYSKKIRNRNSASGHEPTEEERRAKRENFLRNLEILHARAIAKGMTLLSEEGIEKEIADRRGY